MKKFCLSLIMMPVSLHTGLAFAGEIYWKNFYDSFRSNTHCATEFSNHGDFISCDLSQIPPMGGTELDYRSPGYIPNTFKIERIIENIVSSEKIRAVSESPELKGYTQSELTLELLRETGMISSSQVLGVGFLNFAYYSLTRFESVENFDFYFKQDYLVYKLNCNLWLRTKHLSKAGMMQLRSCVLRYENMYNDVNGLNDGGFLGMSDNTETVTVRLGDFPVVNF